jgi:hypothetical protein
MKSDRAMRVRKQGYFLIEKINWSAFLEYWIKPWLQPGVNS